MSLTNLNSFLCPTPFSLAQSLGGSILMRSWGILLSKVLPSCLTVVSQPLKLSPSACSPLVLPRQPLWRSVRFAIFNHHLPRWQGTLMGCFISFNSQILSSFCNCQRVGKKQESKILPFDITFEFSKPALTPATIYIFLT